MELYELVPPPVKREAPIVQLYQQPVQEQVTALAMAVVMNEVPMQLRVAYNAKLGEYKEVSAKLNRHKFMSPTVLELTTERFVELIADLSGMLEQVDCIRQHTLEESQGGFAV
jgi:hypothetical protein